MKSLLFSIVLLISANALAQISTGVYFASVDNVQHELKVTDNYLVHSVYEKSPAKFVKTLGGHYTLGDKMLQIKLEFNSDFQKDSVQSLSIPIQTEEGILVFNGESKLVFKPLKAHSQDLDGQWLFATRGPDEGQKRRGDDATRKTLKFLKDGRFQWIAYDTEGMQFKGTGGGSYLSKDGRYTENIEYFSRDNNRVGASLEFNYEIKNGDWHHTGNNSKGKPMYEIWAKR